MRPFSHRYTIHAETHTEMRPSVRQSYQMRLGKEGRCPPTRMGDPHRDAKPRIRLAARRSAFLFDFSFPRDSWESFLAFMSFAFIAFFAFACFMAFMAFAAFMAGIADRAARWLFAAMFGLIWARGNTGNT